MSLLKCGVTNPKIAETGNFWYKFAQEGYTPLSNFYKFGLGEDVQGSHPGAKLCHCRLKNVGVQTPNRQNWYFWYKFAQKGYTPLSDFYKIWLKGGRLRFAPSCQIVPLSVNKIWEYSPQNRQNWYFLYKFAQKGYTPLSH